MNNAVTTERAEPSIVPAQAAETTPAGRVALVTRPLVLLSLAHLSVDLYSSAVPTLQPVLVERFALSLAQAGWIGGIFMLSSSVLQLPFGVISDRLHSRMFGVLGLLAAAVFLSSLGRALGFPSLLLLVFLGGMGVAAFHPQSTTQAAALAGRRRGLGVAFFISAGTLGLSLGPAYFSSITEWVGFKSLWVAAIPALFMAAILSWFLPAPPRFQRSAGLGLNLAALRSHGKPLALLYGLVVLRSVVQLALGQFLTLYLFTERGFSFGQASLALALFFGSASLGSFLGGGLADRIGGKRVVVISMACSAPFLALFVGTTGWLSLVALFVGGLILLLTIPVIVVMAQDLVPSQAGTVSALMMGFAWGMAGITFIPLIGWLGDLFGLETVFWGVVTLPLLGVLMAIKIPTHVPE